MSNTVFTDSNYIYNYTSGLIKNINQYDVDVIINSKKLQKYKNVVKKSMEKMRNNTGVSVGEPYLFSFEINEQEIKENTMKIYISLELGMYRSTKDERAFFQVIYGDYKKEILDVEDESVTQTQLIDFIEDMLKEFKIQYINDN